MIYELQKYFDWAENGPLHTEPAKSNNSELETHRGTAPILDYVQFQMSVTATHVTESAITGYQARET
jgi:hypothetical protein